MPPTVYRVIASELNVRSAPVVKPANRLGVLPQDSVVEKLGDADAPGWWRVKAVLSGTAVEGYVASRYLAAESQSVGLVHTGLRPVHLETGGPVRRNATGQRASPLNEPNQPIRSLPDPAALSSIVAWLAVERSARYQPIGGTTFCNIYAYDYCCLAAAYLPRVWWTADAVARLRAGEAVGVKYGSTVRELNANALHDWLEEFGTTFGWRRTFDRDDLQNAANGGGVGVIVARRTDLNRSGHISIVVPEGGGTRRARRAAGEVTVPLQSQAGASNFRYGTSTGAWWQSTKFSRFAFWVHP
jgi:hypothetical protein